MNKQEAFARLMQIGEQYPELIFDNHGYQYLKPEVIAQHKEQIEEISTIMKEQFPRFVSFNNFKPRKDGTYSIRCQTHWSVSFIGVEYFTEEYFQETEPQ